MKKNLWTFVGLMGIMLFQARAQDTQQMGDMLMSSGKIYAVITVVSIILLGISLFLIRLDRKIARLEQQQH